ncbi:MAG: hypothetical protein DWQ47_07020 [Acidobacteria bacterium]|nr:MAG: hypothetical protein DWQ32_15120 [Acidobacteriota bacterium]REJ99323.1 MAG: hypothetical protein DWQ38_14855 [Acidobacteriota bacterium]REK15655.1 MAG: hypothetical protein DWQ43_05655 [Acidobacteriota bacterium]REK43638.1 MAG: hypothetical protein DWQ47_07020 [Acidobacteriota bacterium]
MKFTEYLTSYYAITILLIVVITAVIVPYPTEDVPEWKIVVIDENFLPGGARPVVQKVENPYFGDSTSYSESTDKNGFVTFPSRYRWSGIARRLTASAATLLGWNTATTATITAESPSCSGIVTWTTGQDSQPERLVCP